MSQARVRPKLVIGGAGADAAIRFYEEVLGARPVSRHTLGEAVVFAQLQLPSGDALQVKDADEHDPAPPAGGGGVVLDVECENPDDVASAAVDRGAEMVFEVADQPYGSRQGRFRDPFGHQWIVGTPLVMTGEQAQPHPSSTRTSPLSDRPDLPDGYGVPETADGLLAWADVEPRLREAQHYWISSVRPDGRPHSVPRWGVWLEGRFWYDGAPTTRHTRNVELNPSVTLTLESGTEVVIVEGQSRATSAEPDGLGARLSEAFEKYAAYGYSPTADSWSGPDGGGLRVIVPHRALAWFSFPTDCTRFVFPDDPPEGSAQR